MCGIAGIVGSVPDNDLPGLAAGLLRVLQHRGPDDHGWLAWAPRQTLQGQGALAHGDWRALLLHRRLSILDLTENGRQPLSTPDGRYHISFNGEIYNYRELRAELEQCGREFRSTSDTEVLLAAFAEWGKGALPRLIGMFAFAILDTQRRTLFLARDFFGIKPLYYVQGSGYFAFSSEMRALLDLPGIGRSAHPGRLRDYLSDGLVDHGDSTLFAAVRQLQAAHYVEIDLDLPSLSLKPCCYWRVDLSRTLEISFPEAVRELRERFLDSVRLHLRSDVPVGAALSGGIDSSAIVMAMRHLQGKNLDIHTFTYVADDQAVSEERWADLVATAAQAVVHKITPGPEDLVRDLDHLIRIQDVPFGSTSIYAQHRVFQLARDAGIKVMLDGQGADELFAGYRLYLPARTGSLLRQGRWWQALKLCRQTARLPGSGVRGLLDQLGSLPQAAGLRRCIKSWVRGRAGQSWLNHAWFAERGALGDAGAPRRPRDALRHELRRTLVRTSLPQLLRYEDRNSMAFSIESRVPFLTPGLAEFVLSLPEDYFIAPDGTSKWVFREAMRGIVPDAILDRRDKIGFATPERRWLAALDGWVGRVVTSETARRIDVLDHDAIQKQWQTMRQRGQGIDYRVWRWVNLIEWARMYEVQFN